MQSVQTVLNLLAGKKTYLTVAIAGALLFGSWQQWWSLPPEVYSGLSLLALAFLRSGVAREMKSQFLTATLDATDPGPRPDGLGTPIAPATGGTSSATNQPTITQGKS